MNALIISDLHLTEKSVDDYRWNIFPTARNYIQKTSVSSLYILGDLLDRKDRHPAELVNRLVDELQLCGELVDEIIVLKGNHDYLKPEAPFLEFLKYLEFVRWIDQPTFINDQLWLPHSRAPEVDWADLDFAKAKLIFMHQSVIGSKVSNFYEMNHGLQLEWLTGRCKAKIYSGDIHVPQKIGPLTYIGTPHPVSFGDDYQPRMLHLFGAEETSIELDTIQRLSITVNGSLDLEKLKRDKKLRSGDHIKVKVALTHKELSQWTELKTLLREWCQYNQIELADVTLERAEDVITEEQLVHHKFSTLDPHTAFDRYIQAENLDPFIVQTGKDLLESVLQHEV